MKNKHVLEIILNFNISSFLNFFDCMHIKIIFFTSQSTSWPDLVSPFSKLWYMLFWYTVNLYFPCTPTTSYATLQVPGHIIFSWSSWISSALEPPPGDLLNIVFLKVSYPGPLKVIHTLLDIPPLSLHLFTSLTLYRWPIPFAFQPLLLQLTHVLLNNLASCFTFYSLL